MMKGLDLVQLAQKIEDNRCAKKDYIAPTEALTMEIEVATSDSPARPVLEIADIGAFPILPLAHDQIGERTGIPGKYYDRMLNTAPDLLATNVNTWFQLNPEKRMVRTLNKYTRAFLSNRYQRIENEEIAEVALPILADIPDVHFPSCEVTERRLYIQAVSPRIQGEVKVGDVVQAGVLITNSEVGCGAVSVSPLIFRLRCLNGMVSNGGFRAYHVGRKVEDNEALWADDTKKADDRAVLLKVRDMVRAAVDQAAFNQRIEKMRNLTEIKVTGNPDKAIEVLANKLGVTETERGGILRSLIEGADLSAWGLLNAVTAQSHTAVNYDRAVEFEVAGGRMLDLNRKEWTEVLEAA